MKIIENIVMFFKKIFKKEEQTKMLEAPINVRERTNFISSLKVNITKVRKKKVETLICEGDGLGIKGKIEY